MKIVFKENFIPTIESGWVSIYWAHFTFHVISLGRNGKIPKINTVPALLDLHSSTHFKPWLLCPAEECTWKVNVQVCSHVVVFRVWVLQPDFLDLNPGLSQCLLDVWPWTSYSRLQFIYQLSGGSSRSSLIDPLWGSTDIMNVKDSVWHLVNAQWVLLVYLFLISFNSRICRGHFSF